MVYTEYCSNCDNEVNIDELNMIFKCPNCGELMVLCSMCPSNYNGCDTCEFNIMRHKESGTIE